MQSRVMSVAVSAPALLAALMAVAGCGGSGSQRSGSAATGVTPTTPAAARSGSPGPGALQADATSAAVGDIPDNQVFLVFSNRPARYSLKYPEGWAQQGGGDRVTFRDRNNIVRIVVAPGAAPTKASVQADVAKLGHVQLQGAPRTTSLAGKPAFGVVYSTESAPNAVTGKRVRLVVDRYYLWKPAGSRSSTSGPRKESTTSTRTG